MEISIDLTRILDRCLALGMTSVPIIIGRLSLNNVEPYGFAELGDGVMFRFSAETQSP